MRSVAVQIVDDEVLVAEDLRERSTEMGYQAGSIAHTGNEAIALAADPRPDLVLMDVGLSADMDGIEAAGKIRQNQDVPIVYLIRNAGKEFAGVNQ